MRKHSPTAQLVYHPLSTLSVAVVVPKKVEKKAVNRNKLRRRVYTIMQNTEQKGVFIFILKANARNLLFTELKEEIMALVKKTTQVNNKK